MVDLMPEAQFYRAFCQSNLGKLYQTFMSRNGNINRNWNNAILVDRFFEPETILIANFCAAVCTQQGFAEILHAKMSYGPEDVQVLFTIRRFLMKYLKDFKAHILSKEEHRNNFRAVLKFITVNCQAVKRRHELFRYHLALGRGNIVTERPDLCLHESEMKADQEHLLELFNPGLFHTSTDLNDQDFATVPDINIGK